MTVTVDCCKGYAEGTFNVSIAGSAKEYVNIDVNAPATAEESGGDGTSVQEKLVQLSSLGEVEVEREVAPAYHNDSTGQTTWTKPAGMTSGGGAAQVSWCRLGDEQGYRAMSSGPGQ